MIHDISIISYSFNKHIKTYLSVFSHRQSRREVHTTKGSMSPNAKAQGTIGQQGGTIQGIQILIFQGLDFFPHQVGLRFVFVWIKRGSLRSWKHEHIFLMVLWDGCAFFGFVSVSNLYLVLLNWNHNKSAVGIQFTSYNKLCLPNSMQILCNVGIDTTKGLDRVGWPMFHQTSPGKQQTTCMFSVFTFEHDHPT